MLHKVTLRLTPTRLDDAETVEPNSISDIAIQGTSRKLADHVKFGRRNLESGFYRLEIRQRGETLVTLHDILVDPGRGSPDSRLLAIDPAGSIPGNGENPGQVASGGRDVIRIARARTAP